MDGRVFLPLIEITLVDLRDNKCVDELFASSYGTTLTTTVANTAEINCTLNSSEAVDEPVTDKTGSSEVVDEPITEETISNDNIRFDGLREKRSETLKRRD